MQKVDKLVRLTKKLYNSNVISKSILNDAVKEKEKYKNVSKIKKTVVLKRVNNKIDDLTKIQQKKYVKVKNYKEIKQENRFSKEYIDSLIDNRISSRPDVLVQKCPIEFKIGDPMTTELINDFTPFHENISYEVQKAVNNLYSNKKVKDAVLQLEYLTYGPVTRPGNKFGTFAKRTEIIDVKWTSPENVKDIEKDNVDVIINEMNVSLRDSQIQFFFIGYRISFTLKENRTFDKNDYYKLKAYAPSSNRKYHELTCESTSTSQLCIYETFISNSGIKSLKYMGDSDKTHNTILNMLKEEGPEIEKEVSEGNILRSLELLTTKYDTSCTLLFYQSDKDAWLVDKGKHKLIKTTTIEQGRRIFLYNNIHVAPAIFDKNKFIFVSKKERKLTYKLRPYERKEKTIIKNILGFDVETYRDNEHNCHVYNVTLSGDLNGKYIEKSFYGKGSEIEFVDFVDSITTKVDNRKAKAKKEVPYIHIYGYNNSKFDNLLIYNYLHTKNPDTKYIFAGNSIKYIEYNNVRIFDLSLFYNCGSLSQTCESFELKDQKLSYPYDFANADTLDYIGDVPDVEFWKDETGYERYVKDNGDLFNMKEYTEKYCMLDSNLVYQLAKIHLKNCNGVINDKIYSLVKCPTSANMAVKIFNQVFQSETMVQSPDMIVEKERLSYKGGRTEVFKKEFKSDDTLENRLNYYDINSAHPSGMTLNMPWEYLRTRKFDDKVIKESDIISYHLYSAKSKYVGKDIHIIPNLLIKTKESNIALKETEYAFHWGCELKEAIKNGFQITINEENIYSCKDIFKSFAEYFYNERLAVKETNQALQLFYKSMLNSLYGKFGQKVFNNTILLNSMQEVDEHLKGDLSLIRGLEMIGEKIMIEYANNSDDYGSIGNLCRFASYITSTTRCKLSEFMRAVKHENVYYCDTDSVFTTGEAPKKMLSDIEIGKWKLETDNITEAIFIAPKVYYYLDPDNKKENKREVKTAKGIKADKLTVEQYKQLHKKKIESIEQTERMFFRSMNNIRIDDQTRNITTVYNKRLWDENNSYPFDNINSYNQTT